MTAKTLDPILGRTEKIHRFLMFLLRLAAFLAGHVMTVFGRLRLVKNGRIIPTMKIDISLHKKMVGEQTAAISEQYLQHITGVVASAPGRGARLQNRRKAETSPDQEKQDQNRGSAACHSGSP